MTSEPVKAIKMALSERTFLRPIKTSSSDTLSLMLKPQTWKIQAPRALVLALVTLPLTLGLTACFPRASGIIQTPRIEVEETTLERLNPPGLGVEAGATLGLKLRIINPNPYGLKLNRVQGKFFLDGAETVGVDLPGFAVAPAGSSTLKTEINLPLNEATLSRLIKVVRGGSVTYRLDGTVTLDAGVFGKPTLGPYTVLQGRIENVPLLAAPNFRFRPDLGRFTVGFDGLTVELGLEVQNPNVLGFRLRAPLELKIGGQTVAGASLDSVVAAKASSVSYLTFRLDPLKIPGALLSGALGFSLSGTPTISAPGFGEQAFSFGLLTQGSVQRR